MTNVVLERLKEFVAHYDRIENVCKVADLAFVSVSNFKKYVDYEQVDNVTYKEVSIDYLVKKLNSYTDENLCDDIEYTVIDGKPYEVVHDRYIKIIGLKE